MTEVLKPIPTRNSGRTFTSNNNYSSRNRNVIGLTFLNQGNASNADVTVGGVSITIIPGASYRFNWDYPYIDESDYEIIFSAGAGAGARIDSLKLIETAIVNRK